MSVACRHCRSERVDRHGSVSVRLVRVVDGAVVRGTGDATRYLCRSCGRTTTVHAEDRETLRGSLREHLAARVFAVGQSATQRETGIANSVIQRHMKAWAEPRERDVLAAEPDFLLVDTIHLRGCDCLVVCDVDRGTMVDMLLSHDRLSGWLGEAGRTPATKACIPFDPRLADSLRRSLPDATLMVAPQTTRRAVRVEASLALRSLRRRPEMRGRNGMPGPAGFLACLERRDEPHDGWPTEALALLSAARIAMEIAGAPDRRSAEALWPEFELAVGTGGPRRLAMLFSTWREEILEGADHGFVDGLATAVDAMRRRIASRRPAIGLADIRAFVLLRDFERVTEPGLPGEPPRSVSRGRCVEGLVAMLS